MSPNSKSDSGKVIWAYLETLHPSAHTKFEGKLRRLHIQACGTVLRLPPSLIPVVRAMRCGVCVKKEMKTHKVCGALAHNV